MAIYEARIPRYSATLGAFNDGSVNPACSLLSPSRLKLPASITILPTPVPKTLIKERSLIVIFPRVTPTGKLSLKLTIPLLKLMLNPSYL
ncbi:MAG: hypothetical protein QNJ70_15135 [Xenococcaceae cyanobacterium MO_207.B15]|nr:hypothetical protein [Xenococcaceae cyanobacterium MO_207.B15]